MICIDVIDRVINLAIFVKDRFSANKETLKLWIDTTDYSRGTIPLGGNFKTAGLSAAKSFGELIKESKRIFGPLFSIEQDAVFQVL